MTTTYKIADLIGWRLDLAVAIAEGAKGWSVSGDQVYATFDVTANEEYYGRRIDRSIPMAEFHPSREWFDGGPIIEREAIDLIDGDACVGLKWVSGSEMGSSKAFATGPTPLVAAMRAFLTSRYGETVGLPA